jgi:hypothetical protein
LARHDLAWSWSNSYQSTSLIESFPGHVTEPRSFPAAATETCMTFGKRGGGGRRKEPRLAANLPAMCMTVSQTSRAVLVDVSSWGARLRCSSPPRVGEELSVSFAQIRAFGTVAWVERSDFGVHFDAPLSATDLRSVV